MRPPTKSKPPIGNFDAYISANRTCEIGMTHANGETYRHAIELLKEATRVI